MACLTCVEDFFNFTKICSFCKKESKRFKILLSQLQQRSMHFDQRRKEEIFFYMFDLLLSQPIRLYTDV